MKIEILRLAKIKAQWKTIVLLAVSMIASFTIGAYANQVRVSQTSAIAGNHVFVPAPELQIINTFWHVSLNQSLVTFLILNVTTAGSAGAFKLYQVFVEVSCLNLTTNVTYTCSQGSGLIALPTNMNGGSAVLPIVLNPPVDPETLEIHDLSFIVTETSLPNSHGVIGVVNPSTPVLNSNGTATATVTLYSVNGYTGPVTITPGPSPSLTVVAAPSSVTLQPGGTATVTLAIHDPIVIVIIIYIIIPIIIHIPPPNEFPAPDSYLFVTNPVALLPSANLLNSTFLNG